MSYALSTRINNLERLNEDLYTKAETDTKLYDLVAGAPDSLNTLFELSKAINDQSDFGTVVLNSIATKQNTIVNSSSILSTGSNTLDVYAPSQGRYSLTHSGSSITWFQICTINAPLTKNISMELLGGE